METTKSTCGLLNKLIRINNDRVEGYEKAAALINDMQLKSIFNSFANESRNFRNELIVEVTKRGEQPLEGTTASGKIFRAWMDIKAALAVKDRQAIVSACETGEEAALEEYAEVLKSDDLDGFARKLVGYQEEIMQRSHGKIRMMKENIKSL